MSANDKQIGGSHYKSKSECWDYIIDNNLGYLEGTAIKYLTRWRKKNGIEDLRKAIHFIEKLIEVESAKKQNTVISAKDFVVQEQQYHWNLDDVMRAWGAKIEADKTYDQWLKDKEKENVPQHRGT